MAAFVTWTAWLSVAKRPEAAHSYTNNWPYDKAAGNTATAGAMLWSGASVALLLFFLAMILYFQHRYQLAPVDVESPHLCASTSPRSPLTPSQRATAKFFVIALLLFLVQTLLGGKMAHDYADGANSTASTCPTYLPFQIARAWHLQLAIFWIATAWLGMGIFIAPLVSGRSRRVSGTWSTSCSARWCSVVVGSLAGEYLSYQRHARQHLVVAWHAGLGVSGTRPAVDVPADRRHGHLALHRVPRPARRAEGRNRPRRPDAPAALLRRPRSRSSTASPCSSARTATSPWPTTGAGG